MDGFVQVKVWVWLVVVVYRDAIRMDSARGGGKVLYLCVLFCVMTCVVRRKSKK